MLYWDLTYEPEPRVDWRPIDDYLGMLIIMPFGWLISIMTPAAWISLTGLIIALYKISFVPLALSVVGSIIFGLYWPKAFVAMMGI